MSWTAFEQVSTLLEPHQGPASFMELTRPKFKSYQPLPPSSRRFSDGVLSTPFQTETSRDARHTEIGNELTDLLHLVTARPGAIPELVHARYKEKSRLSSTPPIVPEAIRAPPIEETNLALSVSTVPIVTPQFLKFKAMSPKRLRSPQYKKEKVCKKEKSPTSTLAELEDRIRQLEADRDAIALKYQNKLQEERHQLSGDIVDAQKATAVITQQEHQSSHSTLAAAGLTATQQEELRLMSQHTWNPQHFWKTAEPIVPRDADLSPTPEAESVVLASKGITPPLAHDVHCHLTKQYLVSDEPATLALSLGPKPISPGEFESQQDNHCAPNIDAHVHRSRIPKPRDPQDAYVDTSTHSKPLYPQPVTYLASQNQSPPEQPELAPTCTESHLLFVSWRDSKHQNERAVRTKDTVSSTSSMSTPMQSQSKERKKKQKKGSTERATTPSVDALADAQRSLEQMYRNKLRPISAPKKSVSSHTVPVYSEFTEVDPQEQPQIIAHLKRTITPRLLDAAEIYTHYAPVNTPERDQEMAKTLTQRHDFIPIISSALYEDGDAIQMKPTPQKVQGKSTHQGKAATAFSVLGTSGLIGQSTHTQFLAKSILDKNVLIGSTCYLAERSTSLSDYRSDYTLPPVVQANIEEALTESVIDITKDESPIFSGATVRMNTDHSKQTKRLVRKQVPTEKISEQTKKPRSKSRVMFAGVETSEMSSALSSSPQIQRELIPAAVQPRIDAHVTRRLEPNEDAFRRAVALPDVMTNSVSEVSKIDMLGPIPVINSFNSQLLVDDPGVHNYTLLLESH